MQPVYAPPGEHPSYHGHAAAHAAQGQAPQFPQTLDQMSADAVATETFAFTPGSIAIGAILGIAGSLIGIATSSRAPILEDAYVPIGCFLGAALFGFWEFWRRTHKTAVAFWGPQIGVYRSGQLKDVAYRTSITIYQLNIINTIRELMAFGIIGFFTLIAGLLMVGTKLGEGLTFLGIGVGFMGATISSLYARIGCRHFFLPKGGGTEQVMFTRGDIGRFGI